MYVGVSPEWACLTSVWYWSLSVGWSVPWVLSLVSLGSAGVPDVSKNKINMGETWNNVNSMHTVNTRNHLLTVYCFYGTAIVIHILSSGFRKCTMVQNGNVIFTWMHVELATISTISPIRGRPRLVVRPRSEYRMSEQGPRFPANTHSHTHTHTSQNQHSCVHQEVSNSGHKHYYINVFG